MTFFMLKIVIFVAEWRLTTEMAPHDGNGALRMEMAPHRCRWRLADADADGANIGVGRN